MFKVLNEWILVEKIKPKEKTTPSGLVIPNKKEGVVHRGKVIQIGKHVHAISLKEDSRPICFAVGDVIYHYANGIETEIEDKDYLFLKYDAVMAVEEQAISFAADGTKEIRKEIRVDGGPIDISWREDRDTCKKTE